MRSWRSRFLLLLVAASAVDVFAGWALGHVEFSPSMRLAVALSPVPGNLALVGMVVIRVRALDEFQKRVHFEAVVFAFLMTGVAVFIYGYLRTANLVRPLDAGRVWMFMGTAYAMGYGFSVRYYR